MALEGWTGWHGEGKTYNAVTHVLNEYDRHKIPIWSNAQIAGCEIFENWDELMQMIELAIEHHLRAQVLIDEAGKWLSSRFFTKLDPRVLTVLQERRKVGAGLDLYWTAPHIDHVDKILRDVTQAVHTCKRFGGTEYSHDGGKPPRAFYVRTYRPNEVGKANKKAIARAIVPFTPEVANLYTTGLVNMSKPLGDSIARRPDARGPDEGSGAPAPAVELHVAGARKRAKTR
jgi:hypothetical protein